MNDLRPLLNPRSIAVVGASERPGAGSFVIENLRTLGFDGKILPVNPRYQTVLGLPCSPSLIETPEDKVDCVAIVLGYRQVISVLEEAGKKGSGAPGPLPAALQRRERKGINCSRN